MGRDRSEAFVLPRSVTQSIHGAGPAKTGP